MSTHTTITKAIKLGESIKVEYQDNHVKWSSRWVIPVAFGILKNDKEGLLCYRINEIDDDGEPDVSIRLYPMKKLRNIKSAGASFDIEINIGYYLTKQFGHVYAKAE